MKKILLLLSVLVFFNLNAQIDREKAISPKAEQKLGDLLYAQGFYYSAAEYYRESLQEKPNWRYTKYWLAMSYAKSKDYKNAEKWFGKFVNYKLGPKDKPKKIERENKKHYNKARFYYGQALKNNGKYQEAIKQFKAFKSDYVPSKKKKTNKDEQDWIAKANIEIKGAELAKELGNKPKKIKVKSVGDNINTGYEEASPQIVSDTVIYYASLNEDRLIYIDKAKDIPPYKLYQSKKVNGEWQKGKELPINDKKYATGNATISEDGNRMYICKCIHNEVDEVICAINFSEKKKGRWSDPVQLNKQINNPNFTSTQPAVRRGGDNFDIVYFVSDREGGKGGMDIWYFIRTARGSYKGPRLLKGPINTQFDELTPFYSQSDSSFYFSSNGHPSIGGFDVFKSTENDEGQWNEATNVGMPINSSADDLYYTREKDKTSGFLVSNRDGSEVINKRYRGDDIYYFEDFKYGVSGLVVKNENDKSGETLIEDAEVKLYNKDENGNRILVGKTNAKNGEYYFDLKPDEDYIVEVVKPGFASSFENLSTKNLAQEDTLNRNLSVEKTTVVATGSLYDDTDSSKNNKLSNALVTLYEKQIDGTLKRITASKISSKNPDYFFSLDVSKDYEIKISKDSYFANNIDLALSKQKIEEDTLFNSVSISKIELGKTYTLENILYGFGKATLTPTSKKILDDLVKIMQENPLIIIELSAHTDAIGSDVSNLKLSQARAQSCVDYLKSASISEERMVAKGYGESKPIAPNKNEDGSDNEVGRAKNRRTEFKVLGGL